MEEYMFTRRILMGATAALAMMSSGAHAQEKLYIPLISKGFQHQFWQAVKAGADKAAAQYNVQVTFEGPETEAQVDKQIEMLTTALAKKPAAIGFAALDSQAAIPLLKQAKAAGIPIVAFDSGVDSDIPVATASTSNVAASALAATKMSELIGGAGKVAVIAHDQTSRTGIDRTQGFVNEIKKNHPGIEIVAVEVGGGDQLKSAEITKTLLAANPNLKGIFATNEGGAIGMVAGVQEAGGKLVIIGFDSGKAQKDAIRSGRMAGAITQNPVGIGYETVKAAVAAAKGEPVKKNIDTGFYWYNAKNIDSPEVAAVLYD
jgi:ribose transport system substrate-binding protein